MDILLMRRERQVGIKHIMRTGTISVCIITIIVPKWMYMSLHQ